MKIWWVNIGQVILLVQHVCMIIYWWLSDGSMSLTNWLLSPQTQSLFPIAYQSPPNSEGGEDPLFFVFIYFVFFNVYFSFETTIIVRWCNVKIYGDPRKPWSLDNSYFCSSCERFAPIIFHNTYSTLQILKFQISFPFVFWLPWEYLFENLQGPSGLLPHQNQKILYITAITLFCYSQSVMFRHTW